MSLFAESRHSVVLRRAASVLLFGALAVAPGARASGQNFNFGNAFGCPDPQIRNAQYDGRFAFLRLRYSGVGGYCYYRPPYPGAMNEPSWAHGYGYTDRGGTAESHLMSIMANISSLRPHLDATNVLDVDSPDLFKYPVAFMVEAPYLNLNEREAANLRKYLKRGGFLILDDAGDDYGRGNRGSVGWDTMIAQLAKIRPDLKPMQLEVTHPIFHAFFDIPSFDIVPVSYRGRAQFYGYFEGNDPKKRLLMIMHFSTDISDFWEFSGVGFYPVDSANEAYKLGVNYIIYGLTH